MTAHAIGTTRTAESVATLGALASLAFFALGLPDGLLGVAWPSIRATFGLPLDALGALLVSFTSGYVTASFLGGGLVACLGLPRLLAFSCFASGVSLVGYALSPGWWTIIGLGAVAGIGAGGIDTGINTYAATHHGPRMLNWLHACYGVGGATGPAVMTVIFNARASWRWGYLAIALAQVGLAAAFVASRRTWPPTHGDNAGTTSSHAPLSETLSLGRAQVSIALFLIYTGLELAVGTWAFTLLTEARGVTTMMAGSWAGLYWVALTVGRLTRAAVGTRLSTAVLLRGAATLLAVGLGLLAIGLSPQSDLVGLLLAGFAAGPIFPTLIAVTPSRVGARHVGNTVGLQIGAAAVGQALLPSALGILAGRFGIGVLAPGLVLLALLVVAANELAAAGERGKITTPSPAGEYSSS